MRERERERERKRKRERGGGGSFDGGVTRDKKSYWSVIVGKRPGI